MLQFADTATRHTREKGGTKSAQMRKEKIEGKNKEMRAELR